MRVSVYTLTKSTAILPWRIHSMLNTDFSPWPDFTDTEINAAVEVLRSNRVNYWTGEQGKSFETEFAKWSNSEYAIALANGTLALDLAWIAINLKKGDEVIVTSRTYLASVSSIVLAGAIPIFADVDLDSQNITAETIAPLITPNTRAICCVHLAGWPCEMEDINALADQFNLAIVEDCAQAHGASYRGTKVGNLGDISAWSFCQDKIMTTAGEGGMVTTNNEEHWSKMWSYKDHGKSWDAVNRKDHPPGFRWLHESFGTNWRLTEIQSAIGRHQLQMMDNWHNARTTNATSILDCALAQEALRVPQIPTHIQHAFYKCYMFVRHELLKSGWDRDRIMQEINACGVPCYSGSCSEVYLETAFDNSTLRPKYRLPNAQKLAEDSLMFLVHPTLSKEEIDKTCDVITSVVRAATLQ